MAPSPPIWIGTSWKMNKTLAEAAAYSAGLAAGDTNHHPGIQRFVIPPFTAVREVKSMLAETSVMVGAQNMHWADDGPWTGEISPVMLRDCNLDLVELGHSERRENFDESDETVALKVEAAIRHGLIPLICVGETLAHRQSGRAREVLATQVRSALARITPDQRSSTILIAYEPVWAIGADGIAATSAYANARQREIAELARQILGRSVPCLYGGSVTAENCQELISCPHIDGLFIGRAAGNVKGYLDILKRCAKML